VPRTRYIDFVDAARGVIHEQGARVMNCLVRVLHREELALNHAPADMFAVVLYVNQTADDAGSAAMRRLTADLIDLATDVGGTFFLPYQIHYSRAQLRRAYPNVDDVFAAKRRYDTNGLLTNTWYQTYTQ